ncbi:MAG: Methyltransferase type 12 [Candidatus Magasanikbacteria bacterium GW2011_GWC2_37_14]|uniref:Methyltransferase type 12 n=1 Tax=Candidatus Magasanikbacteria bacterium GW2011_GWC2_37_14 TaxID=1619046 RepID=A0A0G0JJI7_9BACT|nr:MAG: Methyltransferase type 12 [Candidatus Magasanikbacteria bacterium GW2011_GWC2_37_14]
MNIILIVTAFLGLIFLLYGLVIYCFTRVPHVITPISKIKTILENLDVKNKIIYDLGCGKGDFLFSLEKFGPAKLVGFELSPLLVWWGKFKAKIKNSKVEIKRKNFFNVDIVKADIIYLFLVQAVINKLAVKIIKEAKPGAEIICLADQVPGLVPTKVIESNPGGKFKVKIYFYKK